MKNRGGKRKLKLASFGAASLALAVASASALPALYAKPNSSSQSLLGSLLDQFTPSGVDARLAEKYERRNSVIAASQFPFTPAGLMQRDRQLTVAARRISPVTSTKLAAVNVRQSVEQQDAGSGTPRLGNTEFRLTAARGLKDFTLVPQKAEAIKAPVISNLGKTSFRLDKEDTKKPSRFQADIAIAKEKRAAPRTTGNAAPADYQLDVGGSFSVTRDIDLTAGIRYKSEQERVLTDKSESDSEAVFVGTKIKF